MYEDENIKNYNDISQSGKTNFSHERGGLIPITSNILNESQITKEETIEYQGVPISDITTIGYIIEYKEQESKVKITLYDYTGTMDINFYNKVDNLNNAGLNKINYDGTRKPVQIFGTIKVYKNEKNIQGAKIISVGSNDILYHRADVIHAWLYLTGKLQELKDNQIQNSAEEAKMIASGNNKYNNQRNTPVKVNREERDFKDAIYMLENYYRREKKNEIGKNEIRNIFRKYGNNKEEIINILIDNNKLIETDTGYEIMF